VTERSERSFSGTAVAMVLFTMIIAGAVYRYWPSDDREIRRHVSNLAESLSTPAINNEVASMTRFAALREYFAPEVRIRLVDQEIVSRETLIGLISRSQPGQLVVEFVDVNVALAEDHATADVSLTAHLSTTDATGQKSTDTHQVRGVMEKRDGDWVISLVDAPEPQRP
jgi:hypothetical protein